MTPEPGTEAETAEPLVLSTVDMTDEELGWMKAPTTPAGRRLVRFSGVTDIYREVLAIEAEARAAVLAEVREGVEGLNCEKVGDDTVRECSGDGDHHVSHRAVLALLDTLSDGGPTDG